MKTRPVFDRRGLRCFTVGLLGLAGASLLAETPPPRGLAEVNGTRLYYETAGGGKNLVLIHGGAVDSRAWDDQFSEFARRYRVIRYDLRGAGRSGDRDKPFSNSEDLYALLRHLRVERTYLAGISRGGGIAYDFTLEHPEMVEGLVLVSSNLSAGVPAYEAMFERATQAGRKSGADAAAAVWGNDPFQGPRRETARARVLEILRDNMPRFRYFGGYEPVKQLSSSDVPRAERLQEIRVPTLVVCGAHDNPVARGNYKRWADGIPGARLVVFPDAAHLVNVDQPEDFNRTVLDFLDGLEHNR
jgi:pimeloyl-ACP methyl ester carboxylesterase